MTVLATTLGLTRLDEHLPTLLLSSGFFLVVQLVAQAFKARPAVAGRVVSMAHALLVLPLTYAAMQSERLATDTAFAWDPRAGITFAVACGYFLWDIVHSTTHFAGAGFVAHAIACFSVYILGFTPFLAYYGVRCLMFEASTPFLNIHWYLLKTGRGDGKLAMINGFFLLASFFLARIIYGTYVSYGFFRTLYEVRERVPPAYVYVYGISNVVLNALNWLWFSKMVSTMVARIVKGGAPDEKKDE